MATHFHRLSRSIYGTLLAALVAGMMLPALLGGAYLLFVRENAVAQQAIVDAREDHLAVLAESLVQPLWDLNRNSSEAIVLAVMADTAVVHVLVSDRGMGTFVEVEKAERRNGRQSVGTRDIRRQGAVIGQVLVEVDDGEQVRLMWDRQRRYGITLALQVIVSIGLMMFLLHRRLIAPLRRLMAHAKTLSEGDLDATIIPERDDELGMLGSQLDLTRLALRRIIQEQGAILDNVPVGIVFVQEGLIKSANRQADQLFGYEGNTLVGKSPEVLYVSIQDCVELGERANTTIGRGRIHHEELSLRRFDGSTFWASLSGSAIDPANPQGGSIWIFSDISERRSAEERLKLSATVFENTAEGVIITDPETRIVAVNKAFSDISGYSSDEVVGNTPRLLHSGRQDSKFYGNFWEALRKDGAWRGEIWNRRKDGTIYPEWLTVSSVKASDGSISHYVGVFTDITQIKESQHRLEYLAHHDTLTQLPNRLLSSDRLEQALRHSKREERRLAVMFLDLDHFKDINDTLGHHAGDLLLVEAARRLETGLRDCDTLARLGGDEFLIISEFLGEPEDAALVAQRLIGIFDDALTVSGQSLYVTLSIGIALFPEDGDTAETLIRNADAAMYQAKANGRNDYRFYTKALTAQALEKMQLGNLLRRAVGNDELYLQYQPQVDMRTSKLVGVEALVRWNHPVLGMISPVRFIPLAEENGIIQDIGRWVLKEACRQWQQWNEGGLRIAKMAVNLSVKQLESKSFIDEVRAVLQDTGIPPECLQLEVTESVIMGADQALVRLNELRSLGILLAIDDFGTGYSSLAYLKQLPVQTLKIDRSFVCDIAADSNDETIAHAIIQLARSMNLSVVAEGVETESQANFLMKSECSVAQGFLYGRPMDKEHVSERWGQVSKE